MPVTLASLYAAAAVDAALDLARGQVAWRDPQGRLVGRAEGAVVLTWDPRVRGITWALHDEGLARAGAPVVPALDPTAPTGPVDRAVAADLAAQAALELGYAELVRVREGGRIRFVAVQELELLRPAAPVPDRLRAVSVYLRGGGDPHDAAWRLQAMALDLRQLDTGGSAVTGLMLASLAAGLEQLAREAERDPVATAQALEDAAAGMSGVGDQLALRTPGELLAGIAAWMQGGGQDPELAGVLREALAELAGQDEAEDQMRQLLDVARAQGVPFEHLAAALQRLLPTGDAAAGLWRAVAAAAPDRSGGVTLYNLGLALRTEVGAAHEAVELLARARDLDPHDAEVWFELGNARADVGDHAQALAAWDRAAQLDPAMAGPWTNRGVLLAELGDDLAAREAFARAAELADTPESWHAYGRCELQVGDRIAGELALRRAMDGYDRRIAAEQGVPYQRFWRGAARSLLGEVDAALADLEYAILADPDWARVARDSVAWASLRGHPRFLALTG